jgi:hypothetical protein
MEFTCSICSKHFVDEKDTTASLISTACRGWSFCSDECGDIFWNAKAIDMRCFLCHKHCENGKFFVRVAGNDGGIRITTACCSVKCKNELMIPFTDVKCDNCHVKLANKIRCKICEHAYYCSVKCRNLDKVKHNSNCRKW